MGIYLLMYFEVMNLNFIIVNDELFIFEYYCSLIMQIGWIEYPFQDSSDTMLVLIMYF
jgi:hypothetical protein